MKQVLVTGATGRTGTLVLQKLRQHSKEFTVYGFARSQEKAINQFNSTQGFFFGDINLVCSNNPRSIIPALLC
jgi:uncharacterized protein YbjT (DUF2867 family)